jgi:stage II sporulation protein D
LITIMLRTWLLIILFQLQGISTYSETVMVSLFNDHSLATIIISPEKGDYVLMADGNELTSLAGNELLYVSMMDNKLLLRDNQGALGIFLKVSLVAKDITGEFSIRPVVPSLKLARYYGDLELSIDFERIRIINMVDEDLYLAGVVEAESGTGSHLMYYMAHSIICRTYLYGNLHRHADEDFDLCDGVHCQVYKGLLSGNETICEAVNMTTGKVIVYGNTGAITAAFHSNCGGETASSEDVWLISRPYLRPVKDPWCSKKPSASWQRRINIHEWERYLISLGLEKKSVPQNPHYFTFSQPQRNTLYRLNRFTVPLIKIRNDWNLRSAFFSLEYPGQGQEFIMRGKGYGHGVGLCQEGAMEMAARGYNFMQILKFYYTNITITDVEDLYQ